ncbi:MAG: hypothetical protein CMM60_14260 [Rhodospirillaceae bacterium]|nr:hypothetical protein [Rhodospirillaceae bacterium]
MVEGLAGEHLLADKAHDPDGLRDHIDDAEIYKERHLVECYIKQNQILPPYRHALREDRHGLHGHALSRRRGDLDAIIANRS